MSFSFTYHQGKHTASYLKHVSLLNLCSPQNGCRSSQTILGSNIWCYLFTNCKCWGFRWGYLQDELSNVRAVLEPKRPFVAIVAGAKYDTKIGPLTAIYKRVDHLILGGLIYNTFLCAKYGVKIKGVEVSSISKHLLPAHHYSQPRLSVFMKSNTIYLIVDIDIYHLNESQADKHTQVCLRYSITWWCLIAIPRSFIDIGCLSCKIEDPPSSTFLFWIVSNFNRITYKPKNKYACSSPKHDSARM